MTVYLVFVIWLALLQLRVMKLCSNVFQLSVVNWRRDNWVIQNLIIRYLKNMIIYAKPKFIFHSIYGFSSLCKYSRFHSRFGLLLLELYWHVWESSGGRPLTALTLLTQLPQFLFYTSCGTHSVILVSFY